MNGRECEDLPNGHILKAQLTPLHSPPTTASLLKEPRKKNSNTITTASANQITNTNVHCENK